MVKLKTKTVSSAVPEDIEKWIKSRAQMEGVSPSLWISNLLSYSMMIDGMTQGEITALMHDFLHLRELIGKEFDFNPWTRFKKNHPEGWNEYFRERSKEKDQPVVPEKT